MCWSLAGLLRGWRSDCHRGVSSNHVLQSYLAPREVTNRQHVLGRNSIVEHLADTAAGHLKVGSQGGRAPTPARDPCLKFRHRQQV